MTRAFHQTVVCPIFIGRQFDLSANHLLIEGLKHGQGHVILLSGEAGIGKSRLVAEAKTYAAAHDVLLFQGNCFQTERSFPYAPLLDLFRSHFVQPALAPLAESVKPLLTELARLLPDLELVFPELARQPLSRPAEGRVYHLLKREEQAQREWTAAREHITRLAASIDESALREHFLRTALASLPQGKLLSQEALTSSRYGGLSAREREVAALVAQGKSNREIAAHLVVSERTAEAHVSNILGKLGLSTRAQIAAWAVGNGLPTLP